MFLPASIRFFTVFLLLFSAQGLAAAAISHSLLTPSQVSPLKGGQGYLLVDLDVGGTAPSFEFVRLQAGGQTFLEAGQQARPQSREMSVELKNKPNGFYLLSLPAGLYQIVRINAPYFDLPYRLDTDTKRDWRFSVEEGKINYIGKLYIGKGRTTSAIDVKLLNRIATDMDRLYAELATLLAVTPLRAGTGVRDDFFEQLQAGSGE